MDKVILYKRKGKYYSTGSFCGYDFTDLNDGIFIGNKIICPTCSSTYNIENGLVDQGPSLRNISSFPVSIREKKVKVVLPDHIPAFSLRETLKREDIDPRSYIIIGDSDAALSAIITLRFGFTGRIIVVPTNLTGSFENKEILTQKFGPLNKSEVFLVEPDLFQKAQIDVFNSKILKIDHDNRTAHFEGRDPVEFEAILFAGNSSKLATSNYTNVHTITDFESHAKVHNEVIKSKHVCILGGTFEAYKLALSIRKYLKQIGLNDIKITLFEQDSEEFIRTIGSQVAGRVLKEMRKEKISVIRNAEIYRFNGDHKLNSFSFIVKNQHKEYYIAPDTYIIEGPLRNVDHKFHDAIFFDKPRYRPELERNGAFKIDRKFQIMKNINYQGMFACGQNAMQRSFLGNKPIRSTNTGYNTESGFF